MENFMKYLKMNVTLSNVVASLGGLYGLWYLTGGKALQLIPNAGPLGYLDDAIALTVSVWLVVTVKDRILGKKKDK